MTDLVVYITVNHIFLHILYLFIACFRIFNKFNWFHFRNFADIWKNEKRRKFDEKRTKNERKLKPPSILEKNLVRVG